MIEQPSRDKAGARPADRANRADRADRANRADRTDTPEADPTDLGLELLRRDLRFALHDLSQPVGTAMILTGCLQRALADEPRAREIVDDLELALESIREHAAELTRILHAMPAPVVAFDAGEAIRAIATRARPTLSFEGIALHLELERGPFPVRAPRVLYHRLVHNLLDNTARHAEASEVQLRLANRAEHVRLSVLDDGVGWGDEGPHRAGGLGLRFCALAAEQMGGRLEIGSGHHGGCVHVEIPRAPM